MRGWSYIFIEGRHRFSARGRTERVYNARILVATEYRVGDKMSDRRSSLSSPLLDGGKGHKWDANLAFDRMLKRLMMRGQIMGIDRCN